MSINQRLIETNVCALDEGAQLLSVLHVDQYTDGFKPAFHSTIGAHFRHVLEHYRCFFIQLNDRAFCYDKRERDQALECDIDYARQTISDLTSQFALLNDDVFKQTYTIDDEQSQGSVVTTLQRELLFLQSHTVHHYAIIGAMTRAFGSQPEKDFGVAIATRSHQEKQLSDLNEEETSPCAQ